MESFSYKDGKFAQTEVNRNTDTHLQKWTVTHSNIMAIQQFYLLGELATATTAIEIDSNLDFDGLKHLVASYFAVVEPNGECNLKTIVF